MEIESAGAERPVASRCAQAGIEDAPKNTIPEIQRQRLMSLARCRRQF
jgi:hypothetical protein